MNNISENNYFFRLYKKKENMAINYGRFSTKAEVLCALDDYIKHPFESTRETLHGLREIRDSLDRKIEEIEEAIRLDYDE